MFVVIGILMLGLLVGIFFYLATRFHKFNIIKGLGGERRYISWLASFLPIAIGIILLFFGNVMAIIFMIHLAAAFLICDIVSVIIEKLGKRKTQYYIAGILALVITVGYTGYGWANAHNIQETDYTVVTDKNISNLMIAQITDTHIGTNFSGEKFGEYMDRISNENPDIVVVTGDFVDESTTREDMEAACRNLGNTKSKYGIYYAFGNHDENKYTSKKEYTREELVSTLKNNGVKVLEDEAVLVNDSFYVIGRLDASDSSRKTMDELVAGLDQNKYMVVLDHQPTDYAAAKEAKVDLLLSGHTHGGQIWPLALLAPVVSRNNMTYGIRTDGATTYIVSSGMAEWGFAMKTGTVSEYVIINVNKR